MTATVFDVARGAKDITASALEPATEMVKGESWTTQWRLPPSVTIPVPPGAAEGKAIMAVLTSKLTCSPAG